MMKIDIVVMWVNDRDPSFVRERNFWATKCGVAVSPARYSDNNELRYVLRSIEQNLGWVDRVILVTNGQTLPDWLDKNHPKLRVLTHEEFMPRAALPTFNSCAIECALPRWTDLSERFLIANDDTFVFRPVMPSYFFNRDGIINYITSYPKKNYLSSSYGRQLLMQKALVERAFPKGAAVPLEPHHNISAFCKNSCIKAWSLFPQEFKETIYSRFREEKNMNTMLFSAVAVALGAGEWKKTKKSCLLGSNAGVWELWQNYEKQIRKYRPRLVCLNDSERCSREDRKKLGKYLEKIFPQKSSFEI